MKKNNNRLRAPRPEWRGGVAPRIDAARPRQQQLLQEIKELESQLARAQGSSSAETRALVPSCQEMIRARRELYLQLER